MVGLGKQLPVVCLVIAVGCGDGDSLFAEGADDDGFAETGGADDGAAQDEETTGADAADETGGDPAGDEGGTGADDGGDSEPGIDTECLADCGPGGQCVPDEAGVPACQCDEGYAAFGMRCLVCNKSEGLADVAIERVDVSMTVLVNGDLAPEDEYENANLWLRDRASGDRIRVGNTSDPKLDVSILPGTYDVEYERVLGGSVVPRNRAAHVEQIEIVGPTDVTIEIPSIAVSGSIFINGEVAPDDEYETGQMFFVDPRTGDEVLVGSTRDGSYSTRLLPGAYDVHYRRVLGGTQVPLNGDAFVQSIVVEDTPEHSMKANLDISVVEVSGEYTLDGQPAPDDEYETAAIWLSDPRTGDAVPLGETREGTFSALMVSGSYEVVYNRTLGGSTIPINDHAVLDMVDVAAQPQFTVAIETATVSGSFTLDDGPVAAAPGEDAYVALVDPTTGDEIPLGNLTDGNFQRKVLPGTYDVVYSQLSSAGALPANTGARLQALEVQPGDNDAATINVSTASVTGSILLDGAVPPTSEFSDARIYLRNSKTGDSVLLGSTRAGDFAGTVIPGTYEVVYVVETAGADVPINSESKVVDSVEIGDGTDIPLDIDVFDVSGSVQVDGEQAPAENGDRAQLVLLDVETGDTIALGSTEAGAFNRKLTGGTYVVVYEGLASTGKMPANEHAGVACIELTVDP